MIRAEPEQLLRGDASLCFVTRDVINIHMCSLHYEYGRLCGVLALRPSYQCESGGARSRPGKPFEPKRGMRLTGAQEWRAGCYWMTYKSGREA